VKTKIQISADEFDKIMYSKDRISYEPCDHDRWSVMYQMVFKKDGNTYITYHTQAATEYQYEEQPDTYDCYLAKQVMRPVWVVVQGGEEAA
jgi:hypothetical protein